ncbi:MAG: MFS transporter [Acidimicrobiales bacterium]
MAGRTQMAAPPAGAADGVGTAGGGSDSGRPVVLDPGSDIDGAGGGVDALRVRSFLGLSLGLIGPRANLAVSGVLLTLLVSSRVSSAVAITFALTANRLVGWIAYPVLGRASDRTRSAAGRRAPYMAAGLFLMGACTWGYTLVSGFWLLVGLIVVVKTASVVFGLTNVAVIPETFGKSRTLKATVVIGLFGALVSLIIKGTVIATWKANDPSSWNLPFREAGALMMIVAVIVLILVRESPAARDVAVDERKKPARSWRDEGRDIMAGPNAVVLVWGILVFWSGLSATGYLAIVYFEKVQHAGANVQTVASYISGVPVVMVGIGLGYLLSQRLSRKQVAVLAPAAGTVVSLVQFTTTHIWQTVVLAFVGAPLFTAFAISLAPMLLQLLPRSGGMGELLGKLVAPFSLFAVAFSFLAAWVVDVTGDYRVIWLFPAGAGLVQAAIMTRLRVPAGHEKAELSGLWERMSESILTQVTGRDRPLLGGVVTAADADAASLFDMARGILGNPYEVDDPDPDDDPDAGGPGPDGSDGGGGPGPSAAGGDVGDPTGDAGDGSGPPA